MLHRLLIALLALLLPTAAMAQSIEGTWDFRVDEATIFRFDIAEGDDGEWHGSWHRPEAFNTDGNNFANMRGPVKTTDSMTGIEFLGLVELSFDDPRPGAIPDIFRFKMLDEGHAEMDYVGTDLEPFALVRAEDGDAMGDWDAEHIYRRPLGDDGEFTVRGIAPGTVPESPETPESPEAPDLLEAPEFIVIDDAFQLEASEDEGVSEADAAEAEEEAPEVEPEAEEEPQPRIQDDFLDGL